MGRVTYDVPLVIQAQNPICWMASLAMVASYKRGASVGVGYYSSGFDPSNSSIPNPTTGFEDHYARLTRFGFVSVAVNPNPAEIESLLRNCGPFVLSHQCNGFPYGPGRPALTAGGHAVVITGIDTSINGGQCWMNNPWGDKDKPILASAVITAINVMQGFSPPIRCVAYLAD
jgi:hypothetical protein